MQCLAVAILRFGCRSTSAGVDEKSIEPGDPENLGLAVELRVVEREIQLLLVSAAILAYRKRKSIHRRHHFVIQTVTSNVTKLHVCIFNSFGVSDFIVLGLILSPPPTYETYEG
jgi:hypothetical protein